MFFALFLFADKRVARHQQEGDRDLRLHQLDYENSSGEIALTTFYYDNKGLMTEAVWETRDGAMRSKNTYRYDTKDRMIFTFRDFSNGLTSYEIYTYDTAGRKTHESFIRSDGLNGTADYVYGPSGRCEYADCDNYKGFVTGRLVYNYGRNGLPTDARILKDGNEIARIDFDYDAKGNLLKDTWRFASGWEQTFIYHYETAANVKRMKQ